MSDHLVNPPDDAVPLSDAIRRFVPEQLWHDYEAAGEALNQLPRQPSYFAMSSREWKAEKADYDARVVPRARVANAKRRDAWSAILRSITDQLLAGQLVAFAQADPPFGPWRVIPAASWRTLRIRHVRQGRVEGPNHVTLSGLHVRDARTDASALPSTGFQGRPAKSRHLIEAEFARRVQAGEIEESLIRQSRALLAWFERNHPDKPRPTAKTIENNLREEYRAVARKIAQTSPK